MANNTQKQTDIDKYIKQRESPDVASKHVTDAEPKKKGLYLNKYFSLSSSDIVTNTPPHPTIYKTIVSSNHNTEDNKTKYAFHFQHDINNMSAPPLGWNGKVQFPNSIAKYINSQFSQRLTVFLICK